MLYKISTGLVDINKDKYLQKGDTRTRGAHKYHQARADHPALRHTFFPRTLKDWNLLQPKLTTVPTLEAFRAGLGGALLRHQASTN